MARKVSGEIKTCKIQKKQKNGDIYVYERKYRYDPKVGNNKYLGDTLLYKIVDGEIQKTRPRGNQYKTENKAPSNGDTESLEITATRKRTGSMEILDCIGSASGIDQDLYDIADIGDAQ